jgi:Na+/proline symporter
MHWLRPQRHSVWVLRIGIVVVAVYLLGVGSSSLRIVGLVLIALGFLGAIIEGAIVRRRAKDRNSFE